MRKLLSALSLIVLLLVFAISGSAAEPPVTSLSIDGTVIPSMAAPNIAEIILEAEGLYANQSIGKGKNRTFINLVQLTAAHMGPQAYFDGVSKGVWEGDTGEEIESLNPDYWQAVLDFLNGLITYCGLGIGPLTYSFDDYVADQIGGVFKEDFTGIETFEIPAEWGRTDENWQVWPTNNMAGGTGPEMVFSWMPQIIGTSMLITPVINASTNNDLELTFKHFVYNYDTTYTLKVQVSADNGITWVDVWSITPPTTDDIGPETVTVDLSAYDGQSFQLAWVFDGDSYGIYCWFIDDILLIGN